jgi:cytochrome P450
MDTHARPSGCPVAAAVPTAFDHNSPALGEESLWTAYRELQEAGPVNHSAAHGGYYLVTRFDDVRAALRDPETFRSGHGHRVPVVGVPRAIPIDYDAPLHGEYRRIMIAAMTPSRVRELQPFLRELIARLVRDFHAAGGGDAVAQVALPLPLEVLVRVVGFSPATVARLRELTEAMWERVNDADYDEARKDIRALIDGEIARHREGRIDDYLTGLLAARVGDRPITDDEAARVLITMAIAGHETTMNAATSLMWLLATDPSTRSALLADRGTIPAYVEEMLRLRTPAQNFARHTSREAVVGGVPIPAGSRVLLAYAAADRDPRRFPEPERFDPARGGRGHLAFGWGTHQCIGATLARTELAILLETLLEYPPFELDGEVTFGALQGGVHYGPHRLPLRFAGGGV